MLGMNGTMSWLACGLTLLLAAPLVGQEGSAKRGYQHLLNNVYLPADFDQQTFDQVWQVWPEPLQSEARAAAPERRRQMAYARYGLVERPDDDSGRPLQYVVDDDGVWTMNCFACHGGKVAGQVVPGLPNSLYALQTLTEETRLLKIRQGTPLGRMDLGSYFIPLGSTNGTTNAVMFGVALMAFRDAQLNVVERPSGPEMVHHDMDAPAWWHFKKRNSLYIDGFAPKGHRALMQFMLVKENGPEKFREWEDEFRDVFAYISSIEPPRFPFPIDVELAERGRLVFDRNCAECHGTYGTEWTYPERRVPIDVVGTDRVRLDALTAEHRRRYGNSWFAEANKHDVVAEPNGYVAPPLDGVWASAPYFHNGSVPTLWHVLHADQRPLVWKRSENGYDQQRVGLEVEIFEKVPDELQSSAERRRYFDTSKFGKSSGGHAFPEQLSEDEKTAVLEYLKTL